MPLYDFECPFHGRFELLLKEAPKGKRSCPQCNTRSPLVAPLTVMRPDPYWSGVMTGNYGYVTSGSQVARIKKERNIVELGDRADREGMEKIASDARKAKRENFSKETRKFLEEQFTDAGVLDSDGRLRPEATVKLSDKSILDPEGQKRKKETIAIREPTASPASLWGTARPQLRRRRWKRPLHIPRLQQLPRLLRLQQFRRLLRLPGSASILTSLPIQYRWSRTPRAR